MIVDVSKSKSGFRILFLRLMLYSDGVLTGSCQNDDLFASATCTISRDIDVEESFSYEYTTSFEEGEEYTYTEETTEETSREIGRTYSFSVSAGIFGVEFSLGAELSKSVTTTDTFTTSDSISTTTVTSEGRTNSETITVKIFKF